MAKIAYIRVSTKEQNTGRQYELLRERNIIPDKIYEEKVSGKNIDRPELKAMLAYVREGDTVYIESISRLARNTRDFPMNSIGDIGIRPRLRRETINC